MQKTAKILVVDDDQDILNIFKTALERVGYSVGAFSDAQDALSHFKSDPERYDLLFADVRMDGMSGFELARQAKSINPRTKILFTTAYEFAKGDLEKEIGSLASAPEKGNRPKIRRESVAVIPKPVKLEKVLASVREVLSDYSSLVSPTDYEHLVLLYSEEKDSAESNYNEVISEYINSGLAKGQLCVYTYIEQTAQEAMAQLSHKIVDYERNIEQENLLLVDFKPFCEHAKSDNLKPFEDLMHYIKEKNKNRADQHVRMVGRAAGWLYENQHFDKCLALERWWHTKPFTGSLVCPYKMSLFEHKMFFEHQDPLFLRHDTILRI